MSDYPDPDEEFELMYGDELELLKEQEEEDLPLSTFRKSLRFDTTPTSSSLNDKSKEVSTINDSQLSANLFEKDFPSLTSQTNVSYQEEQAESSSSRKRTVDELFGDITDIGDDIFEDQPNVKKPKGDKHEEDLALIEHILQLRKLSKVKDNVTVLKKGHAVNSSVERDKRNISFRVPKYPFIGVTRPDKERVYIRFHSEDFEKEDTERVIKECSFTGVMGDSFKDIWKEAQNLINLQMDVNTQNLGTDSELSIFEQAEETTQLWVDLYKPRKYLELLSDESTNRIMLRWLKLWDKVVFNRRPKIKPLKPEDNTKKFFKRQELSTQLDEHGRPEHKVALLCGPPGLGKTTLAHMVAKHAGYNVIEINASDDRSLESFKASLENATQMRSVIDQEKRPNCLIFDEIDGAPQTSIDYLVKFVNGVALSKSKKGKNQKQFILKRPIICICNDVYVPALRPLRQIAFVVNFPPTSSARLAERLMEIARRQGIKTDLGAMLALSEKSNNDIRSCLSVLHFFKVQNKPVKLSDVYKTSIGQKDMQKGLFAVWREIFQIERSKASRSSGDNAQRESLKSRMANILKVVSSFGDYDKVAQGVFENYPFLKLKDSTLSSISDSMEWFVFSDMISKEIYSLQNYSLTSYLQYAFVVWHFVFATMQSQKLNYPSAGYEAKTKETRRKALVSEVLRGMQPSVRAYCQTMTLILDVLPLLTSIITPPFRPVSLHLYTREEKDNMLKVVNIMIDYNLNYIQERTPEGKYTYNLEPNIEEVVTYSGVDSLKRRVLSYSNKQLIAREIELEKMRRFEAKNVEPQKKITISKELEKNVGKKERSVEQMPNHLQKLQAKSVKVNKPIVSKDFFGRVITKPAPSSGKGGPNLRNDIWYQYKEGYNNAVRKKITISSLK